ncbi:MAG: diaminopimelate decarboxylase [Candidatus Margulisbacteria bacterium]|nr:diaminopimelate decarboxylase [Candidatus Margulisiibacteriota bacterium]
MSNLPDTAKLGKNGQLEIGGCSCADLARKFGTPLYIIDEATVRNRCRAYVQSFRQSHPNTEIAFACKALCTTSVVRLVASEGLGLDVSSGGEIYTAKKAKASLNHAYFHGNNKAEDELKFALQSGVGRMVIDNFDELNRLEKAAREIRKTANIFLRINPGIEAHTHEYIKTGTVDSKFGVPLAQLDAVVQEAKNKKNIQLVGLHAHIGSQILDVQPFVDETKLLLDLIDKYGLNELDIGGGIGIPYLENEAVPALEDFARQIGDVLKNRPEIKLILEPGRSIVGQAGVTLYTIGGIKDIPGIRKYIFIDGGMSDNPRPILYQAKYAATIVSKASQPRTDKVTVAGRFCESGDVLIKDIILPKVEAGDTLAVFCTGAYNYAMASNYNRVGRPAMILVDNGKAALVVRREAYEDLTRNDLC